MFFETEFEGLALLPDNVINTLHNIAHCEVHLVGFAQALPQLPDRRKQLPCVDPLGRALVHQVAEELTDFESHLEGA